MLWQGFWILTAGTVLGGIKEATRQQGMELSGSTTAVKSLGKVGSP